MDKGTLIFLFLINILHVWSSPHVMTHLMNKREVFCGSKLTDALALACKGNYYSPNGKRALSDLLNYNEYEELLQNENEEDNQVGFPFMQKESANSFVPARFRRLYRPGGIVDECCHKPCTFQHLTLYCAR